MTENFWKLVRRKAGLSQQQFATKAGVGVDAVRNWEQGRCSPGPESVGKAAKGLGCSAVDLAVGEAVTIAQSAAKSGEAQGPELFNLGVKLTRLRDGTSDPGSRKSLEDGVREIVRIISEEGLAVPGAEKAREGNSTADNNRDGYGLSIEKVYGDVPGARKSERADKPGAERDGYGLSIDKVYG